MKALNKLDLFGHFFHFSIFGHEKFHTVLGVLLTIAFYILFITFVSVFGTDLFKRKNPIVITEHLEPENYKLFNITNEKMTFAWRLEDEDANPFNFYGILYPEIIYHKVLKNKTTNKMIFHKKIKFNPTRCTKDIIHDKKFIKKFDYKLWYCIDFTKDKVSLGGFWDTYFVNFLDIKLFFCPDNNPNSLNCTNIDLLKSLLSRKNKTYFSVLFPVNFFAPSKIMDPLSHNYHNYYNVLSLNLQQIDRLYMKKAYLMDDLGFILKDTKMIEQITYKAMENGATYKSDELLQDKSLGTEIYTFILYFAKTKELYFRSFKKIQELLAEIGGFMEIIYVLGDIISSLFSDFELSVKLMNNIFEFRDISEDECSSDLNVFHLLQRKDSGKKNAKQLDLTPLKTKIALTNVTAKQFGELPLKNINEITPTNDQGKQIELKNLKESEKFDQSQSILVDNTAFLDQGSQMSKKEANYESNLKQRKKQTEFVEVKGNLNNLTNDEETLLYSLKLKEINQSSKQFHFNACTWLRKIFCFCLHNEKEKEKANIYNFMSDYLISKLDLLSYLKLCSDFEKILLFNFNDCQHYSFDYLKKPNALDKEELKLQDLHLNYEVDKVTSHEERRQAREDKFKLKLMKYFVNKFKGESANVTDIKLFELLNNNMKEVIYDKVAGKLKVKDS